MKKIQGTEEEFEQYLLEMFDDMFTPEEIWDTWLFDQELSDVIFWCKKNMVVSKLKEFNPEIYAVLFNDWRGNMGKKCR